MTEAEKYRGHAADFAAKAKAAQSPAQQTEFATMAAAYLRLALQAERNSANDITYETP